MRDFLMLGRQNLRLGSKEIHRIETLFGVQVGDLVQGDPDSIYAEAFLERLGIGNVDSMDYSAYEGASVIHNLNIPVPESFESRYDIVFDGGTLEHLFHFPTALQSAMRMVRKGGYYIACTPSNGFNGHGFYQFSPELFFRVFSSENGFRVRLLALGEARRGGRIFTVQDPGDTGMRLGVNTKNPTSIVFAAQRVDSEVEILNEDPVQASYSSVWEGNGGGKDKQAPPAGVIAGGKRLAKNFVPDFLIEWRNIQAIEARNRRRSKSLTHRIDTLEQAWLNW